MNGKQKKISFSWFYCVTLVYVLPLAPYVESESTDINEVFFMRVYHVFWFVFGFFQPKVVTDTDETELARQLERLERENAEVDGDDDAEEMEAKTED